MLFRAALEDVFMQDLGNRISLRACRLLATLAKRAHLAGFTWFNCLRGNDACNPPDYVGHVVRPAACAHAGLLGMEA